MKIFEKIDDFFCSICKSIWEDWKTLRSRQREREVSQMFCSHTSFNSNRLRHMSSTAKLFKIHIVKIESYIFHHSFSPDKFVISLLSVSFLRSKPFIRNNIFRNYKNFLQAVRKKILEFLSQVSRILRILNKKKNKITYVFNRFFHPNITWFIFEHWTVVIYPVLKSPISPQIKINSAVQQDARVMDFIIYQDKRRVFIPNSSDDSSYRDTNDTKKVPIRYSLW